MNKFIPISEPSITQKEIDYVTDAVKSTWVSSLGHYINRFEDDFADYCGVRYAMTTSNGTTALHLVLVAMGIGEGDEVIVPDLTFIATANAVAYTGAKVVTVDIEESTLCIDPDAIEAAITEKTKAIIPVHLYGHPANMIKILEIAQKHGLKVIEDAAEAHGAEIEGQRVGSFGHATIFSFYGNKVITSGEGGMITTDDEALYERMKYLRDHAMTKEKRYWHTEIGFNYRMTNLQAALGVAQLERIDEILEKKNTIYSIYERELAGVQGIRLNPSASWAKNVYWMVCLEIDGFTEELRDQFMMKLKELKIDSRPYFYPVSFMPMYEENSVGPVTEKVYKRGINIPSYYDLAEDDIIEIAQIIKTLLKAQ
ncbi:DegT/DnrJ/EryC1/StrS family aminotransferase [Sulfurovum sp.]|uniref:DegT/DnrJ/EryC1/StrS family aminotransferase n=1 Tax=Sulfurovum sp. TaxID=1969726 RepID=UPI00356B36F6